MILTTGLGITAENKQDELENRDPFVVTPPRKHNSEQYTASTTPATPKSTSRSTPLHKRFLEEVTMSPGTTSTPPRTPTRSPIRSQTPKQTLEVGQNGFYFSIEIPEKKITPRRAATPDARASGGVTPSPDKQKRGEVKTGGRVRDILRKNLFGTPTKHNFKSGKDSPDTQKLLKGNKKDDMSPSKTAGMQSCTSEGSGSEITKAGTTKEAVSDRVTTPPAAQDSPTPPEPSANPVSTNEPSWQHPVMSQEQPRTPRMLPAVPAPSKDIAPPLSLQKTSSASTPFNIGHLMANHSSKSSKVQTISDSAGLESMPTPLRKMSERLGLRSPNIVRKDKVEEHTVMIPARTPREQMLRSPISALDLHDAATVMDEEVTRAAMGEGEGTTGLGTAQRGRLIQKMRSEQRLRPLLPSPIMTVFPVVSPYPSTATTPYSSSPSTPSRPGLSNRAKSFGTPSRLRSSMQEDMFKMHESLKRSLGPDAFQPSGSRPTTPMSMSPTVAPIDSSPTVTSQSRGSPKKTARPISMIGPPKSDETKSTDTVPRRRINTTDRKPRPKSMIVGSAKILESIASQVDSPRERAKLRSAAAPTASNQNAPTSRPGTAASATRVKPTATKPPASKPQPPARTSKPAPRPTTQPKRPAPPAPATRPAPRTQRTSSASAPVSRPSFQTATERAPTTAPPPAHGRLVKARSKPLLSRSRPRPPKTPEPELRDAKKDSGTATSYTPPGNPTRLPSPVKEVSRTRLAVAPAAAARKPSTSRDVKPSTSKEMKPSKEMKSSNQVKPNKEVNAVQMPLPRRLTVGIAGREGDLSALRTPSKEVQSALDRAIDRKIREDRERVAGWL